MASTPHKNRTLSSYLEFDEDVDYGSDTNVHGDEGTLFNPTLPDKRPLTAPNPFVERGETTVPVAQRHETGAGERIITKPIDEQQELTLQREESASHRAQTKRVIHNRSDYVLSTPDVGDRLHQKEVRSLPTWAIAPESTSPEDIAFRKIFRERYLQPFLTTQGQYKAHLESLDRGISGRPTKGVLILLFAIGLREGEDNIFIC